MSLEIVCAHRAREDLSRKYGPAFVLRDHAMEFVSLFHDYLDGKKELPPVDQVELGLV